ncbi:DUF2460 domain-containing protein [Pelagimonas varians]|uniref:DUF2460 domain-containing protein n=1 Tax=Pelagimonas varians TaxID=696760 RepID=A0A238KF28_9RHOB|nr:DUF2460 domain-containing protein [Pelagimonas varians]PYG29965.1 uncharacterized protein (TIGR02217 family) [Pelagimonas varians]SMX40626.1 hypothetical protein PEV8663_02064 [Pelagimonas varians]
MSDFHDVSLPAKFSRGAVGGPERRTTIVEQSNGYEHRNATWKNSRHKFSISMVGRDFNELHVLKAFWEARGGELYGFRFRDLSDYKSCPPLDQITFADQSLGQGDGVRRSFPLWKRYGDQWAHWDRRISKPVIGSILVGVDGVQVSGWSFDESECAVLFDVAPGVGAEITAGFLFDVPVRFDVAGLPMDFLSMSRGAVTSIQLIEVRV